MARKLTAEAKLAKLRTAGQIGEAVRSGKLVKVAPNAPQPKPKPDVKPLKGKGY